MAYFVSNKGRRATVPYRRRYRRKSRMGSRKRSVSRAGVRSIVKKTLAKQSELKRTTQDSTIYDNFKYNQMPIFSGFSNVSVGDISTTRDGKKIRAKGIYMDMFFRNTNAVNSLYKVFLVRTKAAGVDYSQGNFSFINGNKIEIFWPNIQGRSVLMRTRPNPRKFDVIKQWEFELSKSSDTASRNTRRIKYFKKLDHDINFQDNNPTGTNQDKTYYVVVMPYNVNDNSATPNLDNEFQISSRFQLFYTDL